MGRGRGRRGKCLQRANKRGSLLVFIKFPEGLTFQIKITAGKFCSNYSAEAEVPITHTRVSETHRREDMTQGKIHRVLLTHKFRILGWLYV